MAHEFPILGDDIAEYAAARNSYLHRPAVAAHMEEYDNLTSMFAMLLDFMVALEKRLVRLLIWQLPKMINKH